jgi:hypothetical protein
MDIPGVCGDWSVKDVLGHITTWEAIVLSALVKETPPQNFELNEFNEAEVRRKRRLTAKEVLVQLEESHRSLREALGAAPAVSFEHGSFSRRRIDADTVEHYREHTLHIRDFARTLKQNGTGQ